MDNSGRPGEPDLAEEGRRAAIPEPWRWQARSGEPITTDGLATLLGIYAGQVSTYATLVWQVPALSLTGQSFLLLIVLGDYPHGPKFAAALLSLLIAHASVFLMRYHRGHQINHVQMARRVTIVLKLRDRLGTVRDHDAEPQNADAVTAWDVDHWIYQVWKAIFTGFAITDLVIMYQVLRATWHVPAIGPIAIVVAGISPIGLSLGKEAVILTRRVRASRSAE